MTGYLVARLQPGSDLKDQLAQLARDNGISAGLIVSMVGSLAKVQLRLAGGNDHLSLTTPVEIVSATGTISVDGMHVHMSVSDGQGTTFGGHLVGGCVVYTTVEVGICDLSSQWRFDRVHDPATGYAELRPTRL
jgi:predicted DNA-binding protein with PD1-like motif